MIAFFSMRTASNFPSRLVTVSRGEISKTGSMSAMVER